MNGWLYVVRVSERWYCGRSEEQDDNNWGKNKRDKDVYCISNEKIECILYLFLINTNLLGLLILIWILQGSLDENYRLTKWSDSFYQSSLFIRQNFARIKPYIQTTP